MAGTATDIPETGELVFVTERFAAVGGRLEVAGHWRGVRGLRFMRPVLWLHRGGTRRRLIALLDHKPWAAEDGGPWVAAFEWSETGTVEADRAELEVGTGLVVELPVAGGTRPRPAQPRRPTPVEAARAEIDVLRDQLAAARAAADRAGSDGERQVEDDTAGTAERDALRHERDALRHERDAALADRDRLAAKLAAAGHRQEVEALRAALELARDEADRLRHNIGAADARHARLEADLVSLRADRDRVGAELAASRGAPGATRPPPGAASRAAQPTATLPALPVPVSRHHAQGRVTAPSRIGAPRAGAGLWAVRAVALLLVLALLAAVAVLLVGVA